MNDAPSVALRTAELLSIGTELTVGETRDTNAGDLARDLTRRGVVVARISALPDDLATVTAALRDALERAELVVTTGGLGPTPDDLTREAIALLVGETPSVDPELDAWLRALFERRGLPFPETNSKQAWLIPSATAVPNENGTAPGWFVARPDGRVVVALPGPPREMRPMWDGWVVPRLIERGLGRPITSVTLRLTGIGESAIADRLGSLLDAGNRPMVATYARADAVDIRIWAHDEQPGEAASLEAAASSVAAVERRIVELLGDHVWARGETTWPAALHEALAARGWHLAAVEIGLRGALLALLGEGLGDRLRFGETLIERPAPHDGHRATLEHLAERVRELSGAEVGLAVEGRERGGDTAVTVAVVTPESTHRETRVVFLGGSLGRGRAAIAGAAILLNRLR
ncbi:MAG TPA: molybdopterin-binding protein [Candidatus Limnocylindrales bacterium]|nr:molybdopterin-binding protein [Candidatus Limnocylindrales bacterium]